MELLETCCSISWWHVICHQILLPIFGQHGRHTFLVTKWVAFVTCHKALHVMTQQRKSYLVNYLVTYFVVCFCCVSWCNKEHVEMTSCLSCWQHVTKFSMLLTLLSSKPWQWHATIPTKLTGKQRKLNYWKI